LAFTIAYCLIGYYYDKVSAAKAATKAFVVNRIKLQQIVDRVHVAGLRVYVVTYLIVLDDLGDGDVDLEDGFDILLLAFAERLEAQRDHLLAQPEAGESS
jgi:NADH-quinone oxidoreductase subunit L